MQKASVTEILRAEYKVLPLSRQMKKFLGAIPADKQCSIAVKGRPGSGKSTFVLKYLTEEFSKHGNVLYFTAEEALFSGSIKRRIVENKVTPRNKTFVSDRKLSTLKKELATGKYRFCIVDSIYKLTDDEGNPIMARETMKLIGAESPFPSVSFVFIVQMDALMKRAAGGAASQYDTDILIDCVYDEKKDMRFAMIAGGKNRFNSDSEIFVTKLGK